MWALPCSESSLNPESYCADVVPYYGTWYMTHSILYDTIPVACDINSPRDSELSSWIRGESHFLNRYNYLDRGPGYVVNIYNPATVAYCFWWTVTITSRLPNSRPQLWVVDYQSMLCNNSFIFNPRIFTSGNWVKLTKFLCESRVRFVRIKSPRWRRLLVESTTMVAPLLWTETHLMMLLRRPLRITEMQERKTVRVSRKLFAFDLPQTVTTVVTPSPQVIFIFIGSMQYKTNSAIRFVSLTTIIVSSRRWISFDGQRSSISSILQCINHQTTPAFRIMFDSIHQWKEKRNSLFIVSKPTSPCARLKQFPKSNSYWLKILVTYMSTDGQSISGIRLTLALS
jgi:hypothetical protein